MVWDKQCLEDSDEIIIQWMNQWINDKVACRTAPATPGLLTMILYIKIYITYLADPGKTKGWSKNHRYNSVIDKFAEDELPYIVSPSCLSGSG